MKTKMNLQSFIASLVLIAGLLAPGFLTKSGEAPQATSCITPPAGILSWWSGDGHPFDLVSDNDGTLLNGASYSVGMVGRAFDLDGVDDTVSIPNSLSLQALGNAFSIEAWVKPESLPSSDAYYDLGIVVREDYASGFALATKGNAFVMWIGPGSGTGLIASSYPISANRWYHVVGTYDGALAKIYVNGQLQGTQAATIVHHDTVFTIGSSRGVERFFPGQIDEVSLYDRVLTDEEISTLAGDCSSGALTDMVLYWPFDEMTGTTTDDVMGTNDGTLNGATWAAGHTGGALSFDGVDDYVAIPDAASTLLKNDSGTIAVWVNPTAVGDNDVIVGFGDTGPCAGSTIGLGIWNNVRPWHCYGGYDWDSNTPVSPGVWTHLTYTWDNTTEYIYKNGQFTESRPRNFNYLPGPARIGHGYWGDPANAYPGLIDELKVYDRTLSALEIQALYNTSFITPTDAVARWPFEEGSGTTTDDVVGSNDGTLNGPTWSSGKRGLALRFDGVNDFVSTPDSDLWDLGSADFTIGGWVNTATPGGTMRLISAGSSSDGANNLWAFGYGAHSLWGTGNRMNLTYWNGSAYIDLNSDEFSLVSGTWNYLALVRAGTNLSFYYNGVLTGSQDIGTLAFNGGSAGAVIGARYNTDTASVIEHAQGLIDEVELYQRTLSGGEIAAIYAFDCPGKCKPCLDQPDGMAAWWPLNEGEGTNTEDILGVNDGTVNGAAWATGKVGSALSFDGASSYIATPDSDLWDLGSAEFTIEAWINTSTPEATMRLLSAGSEADGENQVWAFGYGSHGLWGTGQRLNFAYYPGAAPYIDLNSDEITLAPNTWNHIAVVRSGSELIFYYNGLPAGGQTIGSLSLGGGSGGAVIGARYAANPTVVIEHAQGLIDEVGFFQRALTPEEIAALYSADCSGVCWVDKTGPTVVWIQRSDPNPTNADSVHFSALFSEAVEGVSPSDFQITTTGDISAAAVTAVSCIPDRRLCDVTVSTGTGGGTLRLDIPASAGISDLAGNDLTGLPFTSGESYDVRFVYLYLPLVLSAP
jgi:hypothetical protein